MCQFSTPKRNLIKEKIDLMDDNSPFTCRPIYTHSSKQWKLVLASAEKIDKRSFYGIGMLLGPKIQSQIKDIKIKIPNEDGIEEVTR